jgi:16S rRNA (cytosine967-C5)-methyltransferase
VSEGLGARRKAVFVLGQILRKRLTLEHAWDHSGAPLEPRDEGFARAIVQESLRRFGQLEALIRHCVPKSPPPHKAGATLEILIAATCELLFLNVAPHAAVDAANQLARDDAKSMHFKGLINAVLRRLSREGAELITQQDALRLNTPDWLWERWLAHYGEATTRAIAEAHLHPAPLDLSLKDNNDPCTDIEALQRLAPHALRVEASGRIEAIPGFAQGRWWIQDFAASLPARLFGDISDARVLDLCAAPGGKTAELAAQGARVTALDLSPARLERVRENLARLNLDAEIIAADIRDWKPSEPFPFVLLDAPCTATGTIRRHPDLALIKSPADIGICQSLQNELLDAAAEMVAPGGTLIYAVCSLEPEEGLWQIDDFLRRRSDFQRAPITRAEVGDPRLLSEDGDLRTLPCHWADKGGMDGFYAARLKRA